MSKTHQEAFTVMIDHLLDMTRPSSEGNGACKYRSNDGNKCPVGALIEDQYYNSTFENASPTQRGTDRSKLLLEALNLSGYPTDSLASYIYCAVQAIHDDNIHWNLAEARLTSKAMLKIGNLAQLCKFTLSDKYYAKMQEINNDSV